MATASSAIPSMVTRRAGALALLAVVLDLAILAAFHLLQPGVDPVESATSSYAHGTAGALSQVGTLAAGVGALSLAVALAHLRSRTGALVGLILLVVFGVAKVVQSFFPIDLDGVTTTAGTVHNLTGNLAFFALPVAAVLLGRAVSHLTGRVLPAWLGWLVVLTTVGVLVGDAVGVFGLAQRLYLVTAAVWVAACAVAIAAPPRRRRVPRDAGTVDQAD